MMRSLELEMPAIDADGVKDWLCGYLVGGSQEVHLMLSPVALLPHANAARWKIQIVNRSGNLIERRFYRTRAGPIDRLGKLFNVGIVHTPGWREDGTPLAQL